MVGMTLAVSAVPALASYEISDGSIKALWHLSDGTDASSNGNNLTKTGGSYISECILSNCADLAVGNNLTISDASQNGLDNLTDFTIGGWLKFDTLPTAGNYAFIWTKHTTGPGNSSYNITVDNVAGTYRFFAQVNDQDGINYSYAYATTSPNLTTGTWYHLAVSFDGASSALKIYQNGTEIRSATLTGVNDVQNSSSNFYINSRTDVAPNGGYDGKYDEVFFANTDLASTTISDIYAGGSGTEICTTAGCDDPAEATSTCLTDTEEIDDAFMASYAILLFYILLGFIVFWLGAMFIFKFFKIV